MDEDTSLAADLSAAMGDTSTQSTEQTSTATGDAAAQTGPATTAQADATPLPGTETVQKTGPIPFEDHKKILDNARTKAVAEWDQQYGWAKQINQQQFQDMAQWYTRAHTDTEGFLQDTLLEHPDAVGVFQKLLTRLQQHPTHSQALRSLVGRALASRTSSEQPQPDVEITDGNGTVVGRTYSDRAMAQRDQWLEQQFLTKVEQKFGPVMQTAEDMKAERDAARLDQQVTHFADTTMQEIATWPGMSDAEADKPNRVAVAKRIDQLLAGTDTDGANGPALIQLAANRAWRELVLPKLQTTERASVLSDITNKAQVNTVSPGQQTTGTPKSYAEMSWKEAFQHEMAARR